MNKSESKYFNTAQRMDEALLLLLDVKEYEYITVKEICELAGVNRSTFYLHYEGPNDLLLETVDFINQKFLSYFKDVNKIAIEDIGQATKEQLIFVTPEFLLPWLTFIKDNQRLYGTILKRMDTLRLAKVYMPMMESIIYPILDKYGCKADNKSYILKYYLEGLNAIIKEWIRHGCDKPIEEIIEIVLECVRPQ